MDTAAESPSIVSVDVYAFGNRTAPRAPRIAGFNTRPGQKADLAPDENGMVQVTKPPQGASLFGDPADAPLDGHFHRLPAGTVLPQELGIVADGSDTEGGIYELTHHTIYPKDAISPLDFVRLFEALPWEYAGRK